MYCDWHCVKNYRMRSFFWSAFSPLLDWIRRFTQQTSIFSPNAGKYGSEKAVYLVCRRLANLQNHFHFFFYFNNLVMLVQKLAHTDILKINVIKISKQWPIRTLDDLEIIPAGNYMFKVNNRNTRARCEVCSKLIIKIPGRRHWRRSGVFIVNLEQFHALI